MQQQGLDLKAFLDGQTSGGVVDSEGSFTVAREKALKKLASFALPGEFDWVLKIVQAVNIWQAPTLIVRQSRVATSFFFRPPSGAAFPTEEAVLDALNSVVLDKDNPMHALAMALRSLVQQVNLSFVLAVRHQGELCKPIFAGDDVSGLDARTREEWTSLKTEGVRLTVSHFTGDESLTGRYLPTFTAQTRRDLGISRILDTRCFASPTSIELDRRPVARVFPRGDFFTTHKLRPVLLGQLGEGEAGLPAAQIDPVSGYLPRGYLAVSAGAQHRGCPWFLVTAPDWKMSNPGYVATSMVLTPLTTSTEAPTHDIWWVRQGVIVDGRRFPSADAANQTKLTLFLPADGLRTDLSGLQVELEARPRGAVDALGTLKNALAAGLRDDSLMVGLLTPPVQPEAPSASAAPEEALDKVGDSATTRSLAIGFELPSVGLGLLALADQAVGLLAHLPLHDRRVAKWAGLSQVRLERLALDLEKGAQSMVRMELT